MIGSLTILMNKSTHKVTERIGTVLKTVLGAVKNSFLFCLWCGDPCQDIALCPDCQNALPWLGRACTRCALPLVEIENTLCHRCQLQPFPFSQIHALFRYEPPMSNFVSELKFKGKIHYAKLFGQLMSQSLQEAPLPQAIIPVPLHFNRLRSRGFNQAVEIARPIAKNFGLPLLSNVCLRVQDTPQQITLNANNRKKNLSKAFVLKQPFSYQHVAIIDDVMTTGSTLLALHEVLSQAGVLQIEVWCLCRVL
ncbi:MAG TPA: ComF family protein [Gammaproteobacteria bacterium]|nr:ComF family protein [Gammaproteobacteria bacterium]